MSNHPKFSLFRDVVSGTIMAATSVPQLIAYSETVGYASYRGLSTAGPPLAIWGITTGHPYMNAGVTAITAIMTKTDLKGDTYIQQYGEQAYVHLVAVYSLCIGMASIVLSMIGFGTIAQGVPKPIRFGFKWGCALGVFLSALPNGLFQSGMNELKLLGSNNILISDHIIPYKNILPGLYNISLCIFGIIQPWIWSIPAAIMFITGTVFIMDGSKRLLPSYFPPGIDVILVTLVATIYSYYYHYDGAIVGEIPTTIENGLSFWNDRIKIPFEILNLPKIIMETPIVNQFGGSYIVLIISSFMFAAVNFISIMGIATGFESEDGISWNANRELFAQGTSCTMASIVGSAPTSGSLSRSLVSRMTGTTSQLACIITAFCWMYLLPYMNIMSTTPKAALSAVIASAVLSGIIIPKDLYTLSGWDAITGWSTGIVTAISTPTKGFGAGFIIYFIVNLLRNISSSHVTKVKTV